MRSYILWILIVILLIASSGCVKKELNGSGVTPGITPGITKDNLKTTPVVPDEYKGVYEEKKSWLDKELNEWKPSANKPMMFTVVDWPLQSALAKNGNMNLDDLFLDSMLELNPDAIYFSIFPQAYDAYKTRYDHAVQRIREKNKTLIISYNVGGDQDKDPTFSTAPTVDEYIAKEKQYIDQYVGNYNPDYFLVAVEPTTLNKRVEMNWNANDWKKIISETSEYAKTLNPNVKVGAILTIADFEVFDAIKNIKSLDIVGFNIYGNYRIYKEYKDARCSGDCVGEKLDEVGRIGKIPWILETWESSYSLGNNKIDPTFDQDWRAEIDAEWIKAMTYYAEKHGAKNIMPFFTAKFIDTGSPFNFNELERELKNKNRTPTFYAFKDVIMEVRNN